MINEISYKHCICDMCGKETDISTIVNRPLEWEHICLQFINYDLCDECVEKIVGVIENSIDVLE